MLMFAGLKGPVEHLNSWVTNSEHPGVSEEFKSLNWDKTIQFDRGGLDNQYNGPIISHAGAP